MGASVTKRSKGHAFPSENGLTLLETLAAISFTAVLLGVLSQLLFSGVRLWGKQNFSYRLQHQQSLVYQNLLIDFERAVDRLYLPEPALQGDERRLVFWADTTDGLVRVMYQYQPEEKILYRSAGFWGQTPVETPVIKELRECLFEYYDSKTKNWVNEWNPERRDLLPRLIKVTATTKYGKLRDLIFALKPGDKEEE
jgi:type II secretory pathway component PulJ